jgi:hypothetical protein
MLFGVLQAVHGPNNPLRWRVIIPFEAASFGGAFLARVQIYAFRDAAAVTYRGAG